MATKVLSNEFMQNIATDGSMERVIKVVSTGQRACWRSIVEQRAKQLADEITA